MRFLMWIICLICAIPIQSIAQTDVSAFIIPENKGVVYNKEFNIDLRLNSNGMSLGFTKAKIKTYYKSSGYYFDFTQFRHEREYRQNNKVIFPATGETSTSFVFGKINSFYALKAGKSLKRYWSEKAKKKGVMVGYVAEGGISIGILQPYFLKVAELENSGRAYLTDIRYSPETSESFLNESKIFGRSSVFKGLFDSQIVPGIHGQIGLHCDFGKYDNFIKAIETGLVANVFTQPVEIMVGQNAKPFLLNFYLALQFGRRS